MLNDDELAAMTGVQPEPEHSFFRAGYEYNNGNGYSAPEVICTFRCGWVGTHPVTGEDVAFGFMHNPELGWGGTGMGPIHWDQGWNCNGRWPLAGGGVDGG